MTEFELKNVTNEPSSDNLSLKNWTLPDKKKNEGGEVKKEEEKKKQEECHVAPKKKKSKRVSSGNSCLIPPYIQEICKEPKTAELRVAYDAPTLQSTYTYSITWEADEESSDEKSSGILSKKTSQILTKKASEIMKTPEILTKKKSEILTKKNSEILLAKKTSENQLKTSKSASSQRIAPPPAPVSARCDGPCKKEFPSNLLSTIGRCGHYLCSACYGIVKNEDGTVGCSSLHCFWKGASREESKKNYEKDVCRKQREKAMDMNSRGIDVKPASAASSNQEISSSTMSISGSSMQTNSETNYKSSGTLTIMPSYRKSFKKESIKVRLIVVEPSETYGMTHSYVNKKVRTGTKLIKALKYMLQSKLRNPDNYIPVGNLYYGLLKDNDTLGMRRIKMSCYENILVDDVPMLGERLVLIMDMGDYVVKGVQVYLE